MLVLSSLSILSPILSPATIALAQPTRSPNIELPEREPLDPVIPDPSEAPDPLPAAPPAAPPDPGLQLPPTEPPAPDPNLSSEFQVDRIEVVGNTVLHDEITKLVQEYENRQVTLEDLFELRSNITQLYIENGYITSGAFLPNNQDLNDRVVEIQIVEGEIEAIDLCMLSPTAGRAEDSTADAADATAEANGFDNPEAASPPTEAVENLCGSAHLRESYVRSRLARATKTPVNRNQLEEALQLLQLDPLIQQVNAELTAGSAPGFNLLQVQVREAPAFRLSVGADNYQSPSIGSEQGNIVIGHDNVLGFGDQISARYGITDGLDSYGVSYAFPVNALDGTIEARYSRDESTIVLSEFEELDIRSESDTISLGFRQPLLRTPEDELALGLTLDLRESQTFILGDEPFSFSEGPEDGESRVTALRFFQDWVDRSPTRVLAARSQFSVGIDALNATVNDSGTDGRFFAWLGQFQYVQQLNPRGWLFIARVDAQLTPDSLLPIEQFAIGGAGTVRGYRQNQVVADNGVLGGLELRIPLTRNPQRLQLTPFVEAGHGWNNRLADPDLDTIASLGLGVRWLVTPDLAVRVDYGVPLIEVADRGDSLQEDGFSFSVSYQPF